MHTWFPHVRQIFHHTALAQKGNADQVYFLPILLKETRNINMWFELWHNQNHLQKQSWKFMHSVFCSCHHRQFLFRHLRTKMRTNGTVIMSAGLGTCSASHAKQSCSVEDWMGQWYGWDMFSHEYVTNVSIIHNKKKCFGWAATVDLESSVYLVFAYSLHYVQQ